MRTYSGSNERSLTDSYVESAYDVIKYVYQNLDSIKELSGVFSYALDTLYFRFTAANAQTEFFGSDMNNKDLRILMDMPVVILNGVRMRASEYEILEDGTKIKINYPLNKGDELLVALYGYNTDGSLYYDPILKNENVEQIIADASAARDLAVEKADQTSADRDAVQEMYDVVVPAHATVVAAEANVVEKEASAVAAEGVAVNKAQAASESAAAALASEENAKESEDLITQYKNTLLFLTGEDQFTASFLVAEIAVIANPGSGPYPTVTIEV